MSTHSLCFGEKIRKVDIPLQTPVFLYKSGVYGGIHYTEGVTIKNVLLLFVGFG